MIRTAWCLRAVLTIGLLCHQSLTTNFMLLMSELLKRKVVCSLCHPVIILSIAIIDLCAVTIILQLLPIWVYRKCFTVSQWLVSVPS